MNFKEIYAKYHWGASLEDDEIIYAVDWLKNALEALDGAPVIYRLMQVDLRMLYAQFLEFKRRRLESS